MEVIIEKFLDKYNINLEGEKVVVGVSTGVDSMTLLTLLQKINCNIIVAHINHGKRKQSIEEEKYIIDYCLKHSLKYYIGHLNVTTIKNNFQEEARNYRNSFFENIINREKAKFLLLAHHLNDDIETSIMRIIRGSNLKGYSGIDEYIDKGEYIVLRPLLKVLKNDIIKYAKENKITYFNDYTNDLDLYTRNRIRHHIIPELFNENEKFHLKFLEFKESIREASILLDYYVRQFIQRNVKKKDKCYFFKKNIFLKLTPYMQREVLFSLLESFQLSKVNILEILKLIKSEKKNLKIDYKKIGFVKEYNDIFLYFNKEKQNNIYIIIDKLGEYQIDKNRKIVVSKKIDNNITNLKKVWYNSNMLPIIVRTKRPGDRIIFSYGTKKVAKLMKDKKIGITKRDAALILEKNEEILAILGYAKSEKLKSIKSCDIIIELKEKDDEY